MEYFDFNYNVSLDTINCINDIDFTYHIIRNDYPNLHKHNDYFEFTILFDGSVKNIREGKEEIINKNTLFIGYPNESHLFKYNNCNGIKALNIIARKKAIDSLITSMSLKGLENTLNNIKTLVLSDDIIHIINKNIDLVNKYSDKDWILTNSLLKSTVLLLFNYIYTKFIDTLNDSNDDFKTKLNNLKTNSKFYTFSVSELCDELGFSRTHLNRLINKEFNKSVIEYLMEMKMNYVASLLKYTDYSIQEISKLIGYNSTNRLNVNFKNYYKMTPNFYRHKNKIQ